MCIIIGTYLMPKMLLYVSYIYNFNNYHLYSATLLSLISLWYTIILQVQEAYRISMDQTVSRFKSPDSILQPIILSITRQI